MNLSRKTCEPCEGQGKAFVRKTAEEYLKEAQEWRLSKDAKSIAREYSTKNFLEAVRFIGEVAQIAESENHHPDIHLTGYRKLRIELSTHAIGGLSENDFIVAAKINGLRVELKK